MRSKGLRITLILAAILLVPVIPFLLFGHILEPWIDAQFNDPIWETNPFYTSVAVIGCLVADIFLPVPSSNVCTFAGRVLGGAWGAVVCWVGLNLACAVGYYLASWFGWPLAKKLSSEKSLEEMQQYVKQFGIGTLVLFRAVPVLAEASVVLMGIYRLSPVGFWLPVLAANLGLAIAYATLGDFAGRNGWFGLAMSIAFAVPATFLAAWYLWTKRSRDSTVERKPF